MFLVRIKNEEFGLLNSDDYLNVHPGVNSDALSIESLFPGRVKNSDFFFFDFMKISSVLATIVENEQQKQPPSSFSCFL